MKQSSADRLRSNRDSRGGGNKHKERVANPLQVGNLPHERYFLSGSLSNADSPRNSLLPSVKVMFLPTARVDLSFAW